MLRFVKEYEDYRLIDLFEGDELGIRLENGLMVNLLKDDIGMIGIESVGCHINFGIRTDSLDVARYDLECSLEVIDRLIEWEDMGLITLWKEDESVRDFEFYFNLDFFGTASEDDPDLEQRLLDILEEGFKYSNVDVSDLSFWEVSREGI